MKYRGFTLIEVVIALSLFMVGMVSILQIFPLNRRFLAQSAAMTQAVFLGQQELEDIRAEPYANLTVGTYEAKHALSTTAGDPIGQFQRQTLVSYINGSHQTVATDDGLKLVTTTVYWTQNGIAQHYSLSTYVYSG